jgi:hypothetical protein
METSFNKSVTKDKSFLGSNDATSTKLRKGRGDLGEGGRGGLRGEKV